MSDTVILLHGLGYDPVSGVGMVGPALPADVTIVAPAGPLPFDRGGRAWFSVDLATAPPTANLAQERDSRSAILVLAEREARAGRTLLVIGFGQGGVVALTAFLDRPELFAGCAIASGRLLTEALPSLPPTAAHEGKPVFWAHGRPDPAIPFAVAQSGRTALAPFGFDLTIVDHDCGHELPTDAAAALRAWIVGVLDKPKEI